MKMLKIKNISQVQVPIVSEGVTYYLAPKASMENVKIENFDEISRFVKAVVEISEPIEKKESKGKKYLRS